MYSYSVPTTDGAYQLCTELSEHQSAMLIERMQHMAEIYAAEAADDGDDDDSDDWFPFTDDTLDVSHEAPCWWFAEDTCSGPLHCHCGPVSLLEVLTRCEADTRAVTLARHMLLMEELWSHYWSGQGLLEGEASSIGDACAECLINGASHVYGIHSAAAELAEELGEALAAFATTITLGAPKWNPDATPPG